MSYAELQINHSIFHDGDNVVLLRAWQKGERGFGYQWHVTYARYIGRKLVIVGIQKDGINVQSTNGREVFTVPWFVLERFEEVPKAIQVAANAPVGYGPINVSPSQPMREFAGFWVDGAVRQPEDRHFDMDKTILTKHKILGTFDICNFGYSRWSCVYWLDTTTPTELTPKQAFELSQVIYPSLHKVFNAGDGFAGLEANPLNSIVNWGDVSEYPKRQKWRAPTDADKGSLCRVKDDANSEWYESRFLVTDNGKFLVRCDEDSYAYPYDFCEVLD